jgi:hypothetical protein
MSERCWAFLAADFEAAASEAAAAVGRLRRLAGDASSRLTTSQLIEGQPLQEWLEQRPEWTEVQEAMAAQLKARAALQEAGLQPAVDALEQATRAQSEFMQLALDLRRHSE